MATSKLYRLLRRKPVRKAPQRPPGARPEEADYTRHMRAFWTLWRHRALAICVRAARSDSRADAADPYTALQAAFDELANSSGLVEFLARIVSRLGQRNQGYAVRVLRVPQTHVATQAVRSAFISDNLALIKNLGDDQAEELAGMVRAATEVGQRSEELAATINDRLNVGWSRAKLIARDQVNKLNGNMQQAAQEAAGVQRYTWSTAGDEAVRPDHRALNGKEFSWADPPVVNKRTGERRHPGGDIQCRCVAVPVIDLFDGI